MSQKERERIPVMKEVDKHELKRVEAAELQSCWGWVPPDASYLAALLAEGDAVLVHHTRGRPGPRRFVRRCWGLFGICIRISGLLWRRSIWLRSTSS